MSTATPPAPPSEIDHSASGPRIARRMWTGHIGDVTTRFHPSQRHLETSRRGRIARKVRYLSLIHI